MLRLPTLPSPPAHPELHLSEETTCTRGSLALPRQLSPAPSPTFKSGPGLDPGSPCPYASPRL